MIKKFAIRGVVICLGIGAFSLLTLTILNSYIKSSVKDRIILPEEAAKLEGIDCILVLGAGVWKDNKPSPMLEDRLIQGISLYQTGVSNRLLMSGDHGRKEYDEVNVMKQYSMDQGIPSSDIFMDHAGFSTYESLYRAKDIFQAKRIIIVTQKYHLYRALYTADQLGIEAYGVNADLGTYGGQTYRDLREMIARAKDFCYCVLKPEPTYLGEAIPVSGNGNITNDK
jgi:vancomycin permeability regulator SanA